MPCDESSTEKYTKELLTMLRSNVRHYDAPEEPVGESGWISLQCSDMIIVATAIVHDARLLPRDANISRYPYVKNKN